MCKLQYYPVINEPDFCLEHVRVGNIHFTKHEIDTLNSSSERSPIRRIYYGDSFPELGSFITHWQNDQTKISFYIDINDDRLKKLKKLFDKQKVVNMRLTYLNKKNKKTTVKTNSVIMSFEFWPMDSSGEERYTAAINFLPQNIEVK